MSNKKEKDNNLKKPFINKYIKERFNKIHADINYNSRVFFCTLKRINDNEVVEDQLAKASEKASKPKSKKKKFFSACFLILNLLLVALVFYNFANEQGGIQPLSTLLINHPRWRYLIIAIGLYFLTVVFNALKFAILIKNKTGKLRPWFSFKLATIGRYYDFVTPLGSGGQPFEIYYLKKNGYSGDEATAIPLAKYMGWQISCVLLCTFILIAYSKNYINTPVVLILAWIGLSITLMLFMFVLFMSITRKFGSSCVVAILKLLHKMKIIKNYKIVLIKVLRFVKSYQYCIKSFAKSPLVIVSEVFVSIGSTIANASIAFYILLTFTPTPNISWWSMVYSCCICEVATTFFPMPGGSGAQELSFNSLLGSLFPDGTLFWGILFWRILTYYMYIIQGGIVLILDSITLNKRHNKALKELSVSEVQLSPTNEPTTIETTPSSNPNNQENIS